MLGTRPAATFEAPRAYWVPATKPELIERLRAHGVVMQVLTEPRTLEVDMARLVDPKPAAEPFEGHQGLTAGGVKLERRRVTLARRLGRGLHPAAARPRRAGLVLL